MAQNQKIYGFKEQKKLGDAGEADFLKYYADLGIKQEDGRKWDFSWDGRGLELKHDTYFMEKTPNIFLEIFSNIDKGTLGGVYRADNDNAEFFVYYFSKNKTFLWYRTKELAKFLNDNQNRFQKRLIRNHSHTTEGCLVPRTEVEQFLFRKDVF